MVTDKEFESLPSRLQEQVRRHATSSQAAGWQSYYAPAQPPTRFRRVGKYQNLSVDVPPSTLLLLVSPRVP